MREKHILAMILNPCEMSIGERTIYTIGANWWHELDRFTECEFSVIQYDEQETETTSL